MYYRVHVAGGPDATSRAERIVTAIWAAVAEQDDGAQAYADSVDVWFRGTKAEGYDLLLSRAAWRILREQERRDLDAFTRQALAPGGFRGAPPLQTDAELVPDPELGEYSRVRF